MKTMKFMLVIIAMSMISTKVSAVFSIVTNSPDTGIVPVIDKIVITKRMIIFNENMLNNPIVFKIGSTVSISQNIITVPIVNEIVIEKGMIFFNGNFNCPIEIKIGSIVFKASAQNSLTAIFCNVPVKDGDSVLVEYESALGE